jgi:hypothetical protein
MLNVVRKTPPMEFLIARQENAFVDVDLCVFPLQSVENAILVLRRQ